eukprot:gene2408-8719_t
MDSYDYAKALGETLPVVAKKQIGKGGYMVLRPDSGDPNDAILMGLVAAEKVLGAKGLVAAEKVLGAKGLVAAEKGLVAAEKGLVAAEKGLVAAEKGLVAAEKGLVAAEKGLVAAEKGLVAAEKVFGAKVNKKGYKVIQGCGVIQADGIDIETMKKIAGSIEAAGFSADNVSYGMGGGLLQKPDYCSVVNDIEAMKKIARSIEAAGFSEDNVSYGMGGGLLQKLNHIVYTDGGPVDIMKQPMTDSGKFSHPGQLAVKRVNGIPTVFPKDSLEVSAEENMLKVVYDMGPLEGRVWDDFDTVRKRVLDEWSALPKTASNISVSMKEKVKEQMAKRGKKPPTNL